MRDCVVVGGGPAGLTAALYLARFLRSVTLFDSEEGRARMIPRTHNLGPFPDGVSGPDVLERMRSHAVRYGASIHEETVNSIECRGALFHVTTADRVTVARYVILATGVFNLRPPLSVEDHDSGLARGLIRYCPVCDAFEVRGKRIAVLGSGPHGFEEARFICAYSPSVTLIPADGALEVADQGVSVLNSPMKSISLTDAEVVVTLANGDAQRFDTLYVALGTTARTDLATRLGANLAESGCLVVDLKQRTNVDRFYAVGDIADGLDQIAVAMGQGAVAATAIHNELRK